VAILRIRAADLEQSIRPDLRSGWVLACAAAPPLRLTFSCTDGLRRRSSLLLCCPARETDLRPPCEPSGVPFGFDSSLRPRENLRLCRAQLPSTCVAGASARLLLRANLRLAVRLFCRLSQRAPLLSLRSGASFRGHPSDSNCRLFSNLFVRICVLAGFWLAPLPHRSASHSVLPTTCAADGASCSAVLPARPTCVCPASLPASPSVPPRACARLRTSGSAFLPNRLSLRRVAGLSASPSYLTAGFPAAFFLWRCPWLFLGLSPSIPP
jgi:hypothetical protein